MGKIGSRFEQLLDEIKIEYDEAVSDSYFWREKFAEVTSQMARDKEIQRLTDELKETKFRSLLVMTENERELLGRFRQKHNELCKCNYRFLYELAGTGVGTVAKVTCPVCGEQYDFTDYEAF